jgi:hypothetical protein
MNLALWSDLVFESTPIRFRWMAITPFQSNFWRSSMAPSFDAASYPNSSTIVSKSCSKPSLSGTHADFSGRAGLPFAKLAT